jgi:hypothetical protein
MATPATTFTGKQPASTPKKQKASYAQLSTRPDLMIWGLICVDGLQYTSVGDIGAADDKHLLRAGK